MSNLDQNELDEILQEFKNKNANQYIHFFENFVNKTFIIRKKNLVFDNCRNNYGEGGFIYKNIFIAKYIPSKLTTLHILRDKHAEMTKKVKEPSWVWAFDDFHVRASFGRVGGMVVE